MNAEPTNDALVEITRPDPSPTLTVLRRLTGEREEITIRRDPMKSPELPPVPARIEAGRRAHTISTLTHLARFVEVSEAQNALAFYNPSEVAVVLDRTSNQEQEVVTCSLARHPSFARVTSMLGKPMNQPTLLRYLRANERAINFREDGQAEYMVGIFASLTGTLVHDSDEFLDMQRRCATFTVRRKGRGNQPQQDREVGDVPTQFRLRTMILLDDSEPTEFVVQVHMRGSEGAEIGFELTIENLEDLVTEHVDERLQDFERMASFPCLAGTFHMQPWAEQKLPRSISELMELQTRQMAAVAGRKD